MKARGGVLAWTSAILLALAPALASADSDRLPAPSTERLENRPMAGPLAGRPIERSAIVPNGAAAVGAFLAGAVLLCLFACTGGGGGGGSAPETNGEPPGEE